MSNYITSVGTQQFSITIASGSTTGTATITAVGSGAFIVYGGVNPSVSNNPSEDFARITKTNSTTITATRNTGTAGTIVVTGCIIDGDTANLIKSVQYGTVSIPVSTASATAAISAVTNNNTAIHVLGWSDAGISLSETNDFIRIALAGTTVTATRISTTGGAVVVGFIAIEFQGTALNQAVQNVSASSSSSVTSFTATITTVNTSNSIMTYAGETYATTANNPARFLYRGDLTNSTTVTATINSASAIAKVYNCSVVEFVAGVLNSAVQRGTTTLTAATSNTSTITSVTLGNSGINYLGNTATATTAVLDQCLGQVALTNGTTVTTTKVTATANITSSWEVFEFPAFSGGGVVTIGFTGFGCGGIVNTTGSGTVGWASCG